MNIIDKISAAMQDAMQPENLFNTVVFLGVMFLISAIPFVGVPIVVLITIVVVGNILKQ